jgi:hypothetical protein
MAGHSGYHVQQGGMDTEANKLDSAGDDTGDIKSALADAVCFDDDIPGGSDSGPAYRSFSTAWQDEAKTLESALHDLAGKIRAGQAGADRVEGYNNDDERSGHAMMIIGQEGDMLQVYNPWGTTTWVSEDDFVNGRMDKASDNRMPDAYAVHLPAD